MITGGSGNDTLDGGAGGNDTLIGGAGDDTYIIRNAGDVVTENAGGGIDTVKTALGDLHPGRQPGEPHLHRHGRASPARATRSPT